MECNKDEAIRAKEIAEEKFGQHDFVGAKKFALKARQLFPDLDGLPQLIAVLDVHLIAHEKINGVESNWYGVLQLDPAADEATIRKQYRKLALLLHPDKNKAIGADAAFKIISEAWGVLSDKTKKAMHDMRRSANASQTAKVTSSTSSRSNNFDRPAAAASPIVKPSPCHNPPKPTPEPPLQPQAPQSQSQVHAQVQASGKSVTFWTACPSCKMQYEYLRIYENQNLACPTCFKPFVAREVQVVGVTAWWPPPYQQGFGVEDGNVHFHVNKEFARNCTPNGNFPWGEFRKDTTTQVVQGTDAKLKRGKVQKVGKKEQLEKNQQEEAELEKAKKVGNSMASAKVSSEQVPASQCKMTSRQAVEADKFPVKMTPKKSVNVSRNESNKHNEEARAKKGEEENNDVERIPSEEAYGSGATDSTAGSKSTSTFSQCKRNVANTFAIDDESQMEFSPSKKTKADVERLQNRKQFGGSMDDGSDASKGEKFNIHAEFSTTGDSEIGRKCEFKVVDIEDKGNTKNKGIAITDADSGKSLGDCNSHDAGVVSNLIKDSTRQQEASELNISKTEIDCSEVPIAGDENAMNVPDSDFYDFDKDRTEPQFAMGQIWAVYDDDDGMPRYYARINKILSVQPFKLQMAWLEPRRSSRAIISWLESGFSCSCGEYKLAQVTIQESVNIFSHLVNIEIGHRGTLRIYPRKGDIWALYKGWNVAMKANDEKRGYEMVEVLTDYKEDEGVNILFLVKMQGFKTLFQRDGGVYALVSSNELLRFSHQVPAHRLTSAEGLGVPEGCLELDPASTPFELIMGECTN